jgi:hypothetical protein
MTHSVSTACSDQYCPFLELPGELRNVIYAHALYEPAGLRFRQDDYGIGRLENASSAVPSKPSLVFATCKTENITRREIDTAASRAANQLQYVSREIRKETRGLGIRYNEISFDRLNDIFSFIALCPKSENKHLRMLRLYKTLYTTNGSPNQALQPKKENDQIFQFCEANPNVVIDGYIQGWQQTDPMFLPYSILVEMQFRNTSNRIADFFTDPELQHAIKEATMRKVSKAQQVLPANFKLFPDDKKFDEKAFREAAADLVKLFGADVFDHAVEGGIERWVPLVRRIYEEGI